MPKFAVYYIPEADDENSKYFKFYHLGSSILGYDVRAGEPVPMPSELRAKLGEFDLLVSTIQCRKELDCLQRIQA
jgi:hypothetical protein